MWDNQNVRGARPSNYSEPPIAIAMKDNTDKRLFFGSVAPDITSDILTRIIEEISGPRSADCYVNNEKCFAFADFLNREDATKVKKTLDGRNLYGRTVIIRRANHKSSIFVKDIPESVSNEIMYKAFEQFGPIDRAIIVTDAHGKSLRYGFVEFAQKRSVSNAVTQCGGEHLFCLAKNTPPVRVEVFIPTDSEDGCPEHRMSRNYAQIDEVSVAPLIVAPGSFAQTQYKKWREMTTKQDKEIAALKEKHKLARTEMSRGIKKEIHENENKSREEERTKQLKEWQAVQDKEIELANAARELERLKSAIGARARGSSSRGGAMFGPPAPSRLASFQPQHGGYTTTVNRAPMYPAGVHHDRPPYPMRGAPPFAGRRANMVRPASSLLQPGAAVLHRGIVPDQKRRKMNGRIPNTTWTPGGGGGGRQ